MNTSEAALRAAMKRLLEGAPISTDGALTKNNLYREACVSRATMNRYTDVINEWNTSVAALLTESPEAKKPQTEESRLRKELRQSHREVTNLKGQLNAAATIIATLSEDNRYVREKLLGTGEGVLIDLSEERMRRDQGRD